MLAMQTPACEDVPRLTLSAPGCYSVWLPQYLRPPPKKNCT